MGCDIHMYVERRVHGRWQAVSDPQQPEAPDAYHGWFCGDRSYRLFAILADVRNYDGLVPISGPRGLPKNVSKAIRLEAAGAVDCHSFTWLGVDELLAFDWDQPAGETTRFVSPEDAEAYRASGTKPLSSAMYDSTGWESLTWPVTYRDCAPGFQEDLEKLRALAEPRELRLVFWFDN